MPLLEESRESQRPVGSTLAETSHVHGDAREGQRRRGDKKAALRQ